MLYSIAKFLIRIYYTIFLRLEVVGRENVPADGGLVVCANHINWADALTMAVAMKRVVRFMGKKELYRIKFFSFVLRALNSFPVDREITDMRAYKTAIGLLNEGSVLGIFVQGHRYGEDEDIDLAKAKSGAAFFALKSNAAIVPARITGSYRLFSKITISFGPPLDYSSLITEDSRVDSKKVDALTEMIISAINSQ